MIRTNALLSVVATAVIVLICLYAARGCDRPKDKAPIMAFSVRVETPESKPFFEGLQKFATAQGFAIHIAPVRPDGQHFAIDLMRQDLSASAVNAFDVHEYAIYFYSGRQEPPRPEILDEVSATLLATLSRIGGVVIVRK
jgi:hypothetical protein